MESQKTYEQLNRPSISQLELIEKIPVRLILDHIRSGLNIGSAFRTSDAFGVSGIDICGQSAIPPHREILKTALGATDSVEWKYYSETEDAISDLRSNGYKIIAIETAINAISLEKYNFSENIKTAFVFGNEVRGISPEILSLCDESIEIPQVGIKHSFNISVSLGIVLWEYFRQSKLS